MIRRTYVKDHPYVRQNEAGGLKACPYNTASRLKRVV